MGGARKPGRRKLWLLGLVPLAILLGWRWSGSSASTTRQARVRGVGQPAAANDSLRNPLDKLTRRIDLAGLGRRAGVPGSSGGEAVVRVLVIDARGAPARGVTVDGSLLEGDLLEPPLPVVTDGAGEALLRVALPLGGRATGVLSAQSGALAATSEPIQATFPDNRRFAIQIQLAEKTIVHGTVLLDGRPVAGARLAASSADSDGAVVARAVSERDGRFQIVLPAPATYQLLADYLGMTGRVPRVELEGGQRERTVDVTLLGQDAVVLVRDSEDRPLAGVEVRNHESDATLAVTDQLGRAQVRGSLAEGELWLHFRRDGFAPAEATWDPAERPAGDPMVVIMQPALELAGVVDSPPDALVELWAEPVGDDLDGERRTIATLRQPGPFRAQLDGALDGQYTVGGYVEGVGELTPRVVELRHGNLVDVGTLEASGARGVLTGWVHDNGRPQPYVDVKVRARGSRSIVTQMTTNNGKFSLDLPAGEYLVAAFLGPRFIGQQEAVVGPNGAPLEFALPACSQWSLPSFDRVTDDGIVVVEALGSGLHAGDRIMEINGAPATQDAETLDSPEPLNATVIGSTGVAFEATLVPICIR